MNEKFKIAVQACTNSYEGEYGKVERVFNKVIPFKKGHTSGHVGVLGYDVYVVFQGSKEKKDWWDNVKFWKRRVKGYKKIKIDRGVKVHTGIENQFQTILPVLDELLWATCDKKTENIYFVGHSLGGGLATRAYVYFKNVFIFCDIFVIKFGSMRVGNKKFTELIDKKESYSFQYGLDSVCSQPPWFFGYRHEQKLIQLNIPWYDILLFPIFAYPGNPWDHYPQKYKKAIFDKY